MWVDAGATADAALAGSGSVRAGASALVRGRDVPVSVSVDTAALAAFAARVDDGPGTAPVDASVRLGRDGQDDDDYQRHADRLPMYSKL